MEDYPPRSRAPQHSLTFFAVSLESIRNFLGYSTLQPSHRITSRHSQKTSLFSALRSFVSCSTNWMISGLMLTNNTYHANDTVVLSAMSSSFCWFTYSALSDVSFLVVNLCYTTKLDTLSGEDHFWNSRRLLE